MIVNSDLILKEDLILDEDLIVDGNIYGIDGRRFNIDAWDINAGNIKAGDINAWDIKAWDIKARDIRYFAVCFAYYNIKCKSIKGIRENCKHFVLDGEIKTKVEEEK